MGSNPTAGIIVGGRSPAAMETKQIPQRPHFSFLPGQRSWLFDPNLLASEGLGGELGPAMFVFLVCALGFRVGVVAPNVAGLSCRAFEVRL